MYGEKITGVVDLGDTDRNAGVGTPDKQVDGHWESDVDYVNHPPHYQKSWGEVIDITETYNFNMGNAIKYIMRADDKGKPIEDLRKAAWYIARELQRRGEK
jgi:hypothetical protein